MLRVITLGRRFFCTEAGRKPSKWRGPPRELVRHIEESQLVDASKLRMPKHPFVMPPMLDLNKPQSPQQMWREVPGIVKRMKELYRTKQPFGAACVFESHIATHPALRLHPEALVTAIQIYADLEQLGHAEDIVDFVEEYKIQAPDVYPQLLRVYIRKGEILKAEDLVLRMKRAKCELSPDLYYKLAQLFSTSGRENALVRLHEETQLWCPEASHRIQAVLVRYFITTRQLQRAQEMMQDMYATGVPFHHSIFSALLSYRISEGQPTAIRVTLDEMNALGVQPHEEFCLRVIRTLLSEGHAETALNFLKALIAGNHTRQSQYYHLIMRYHRNFHQNWQTLAVYNALREDKRVKLTDYSFLLAVPALSWLLQTEPLDSRPALVQILLTILNDMIKSRVDPDPMSVGYMMDLLLANDLAKEGASFSLFASQELREGRWKRTTGAIQAIAYGLYHFSSLNDQRDFAEYVIRHSLVPTSFVLAIVIRHMKLEEDNYRENLPECVFDLNLVVGLLERHAQILEMPAYTVDRFARLLQSRGLDELASRMFAAVMNSRTPIDISTIGSYRRAAAWLLDPASVDNQVEEALTDASSPTDDETHSHLLQDQLLYLSHLQSEEEPISPKESELLSEEDELDSKLEDSAAATSGTNRPHL